MTSCSSSVSVPVKKNNADDQRSKSTDTVCTNSSCFLRRKPKNLGMYTNRSNHPKYTPVTNNVRQRVLSAKLLKLRSLQSQLNDANLHLSELAKENQVLKNLQKRQDKALSKYENTNAELPRLIRGHEEQIRMLTEKTKVQRGKIRELTDLLKNKDEEIHRIQERLSYLDKLNKDKRLVDKEKLLDQIDELKVQLQKADEFNTVLNRKLTLEYKTSKQKLNNENLKFRNSQRELHQALTEIERLTGLLETKDNTVHPRKNRFARLQSVSMVNLHSLRHNKPKPIDKLATIEDDGSESLPDKTPVSNIKLEPIKCRQEEHPSKKPNGILDSPSENIMNRLSNSSKSKESCEESSNFSGSGEDEQFFKLSDGSDLSLQNFLLSDENKGQSLEELDAELDAAIKKAERNVDTDFEAKMGVYRGEILNNVKECSDRVEYQAKSLKISKEDTKTIIETFDTTQKLEKKLNKSLLNFDPLNEDFLSSVLSDDKPDRNGNVKNAKKETKFGVADRKKLLDTLKAIDDNENLDFDDIPLHKKNFSREIDELLG